MKWAVKTKGAVDFHKTTNFPCLAEKVTGAAGACDGAGQMPLSQIHRAGMTLLTNSKPSPWLQKTQPAQICRIQEQERASCSVKPHFFPSQTQHFFFPKPCKNPPWIDAAHPQPTAASLSNLGVSSSPPTRAKFPCKSQSLRKSHQILPVMIRRMPAQQK